jgi:hypothetical protein
MNKNNEETDSIKKFSTFSSKRDFVIPRPPNKDAKFSNNKNPLANQNSIEFHKDRGLDLKKSVSFDFKTKDANLQKNFVENQPLNSTESCFNYNGLAIRPSEGDYQLLPFSRANSDIKPTFEKYNISNNIINQNNIIEQSIDSLSLLGRKTRRGSIDWVTFAKLCGYGQGCMLTLKEITSKFNEIKTEINQKNREGLKVSRDTWAQPGTVDIRQGTGRVNKDTHGLGCNNLLETSNIYGNGGKDEKCLPSLNERINELSPECSFKNKLQGIKKEDVRSRIGNHRKSRYSEKKVKKGLKTKSMGEEFICTINSCEMKFSKSSDLDVQFS